MSGPDPEGPAGPAGPADAASAPELPDQSNQPDRPGWGRAAGGRTTALLLRHGQTELSVERRFAGREDIPLTKEGIRQAGAAARRLAGSGVDVIASSPSQRARRTAEPVAEATGAPLVVDDGLLEADFGAWYGLTFGEVSRKWPDELAAWLASADAAPPGGESFAAVAQRVLAAFDKLVDGYRHQRLVIVSHVTPIKTLVCRTLLAPPAAMFRIDLDVASLSRIDVFDDGQSVLRSLNDTAHLRQPDRGWPRSWPRLGRRRPGADGARS